LPAVDPAIRPGKARRNSASSSTCADGSLGRVVAARGCCYGGDTKATRGSFVMTAEARPEGLMLWDDGPDWMPASLRPGYDTFLNVYSHIIILARHALGASPVLVESSIAGAPKLTIDFDGIPSSLEFANQTTGAWQEGLAITFEHGAMTIALPPPSANRAEARVTIDNGRRTIELPSDGTWSFRRQADAFVSDIVSGSRPLASGEDSVADIALAEAIWHADG
jgi:predicted dehydrogenase